MYLAFTRASSTGGTTYLAFDLNQDPLLWRPNGGTEDVPCRKDGDILIAYTTTGGQSSVGVERWVTTGAPAANGCARTGHVVAASNVEYQAATNATAIPANQNFLPGHFQNSQIPARQFGEAAINLTTALASVGGECEEFASAWMHTRAADTLTSALKDYVRPHRLPIAICKPHPQLTTTTQRRVVIGQAIHDTAHLSNGHLPEGELTFSLYGPNDRRCTGNPADTFPATVDDNGYYQTPDFTPTQPGTYR